MKIKSETKAKEFVAKSVFELLEKCEQQNLNEGFYFEVALYIFGVMTLREYGKESFERVIEQVRENGKFKTPRPRY